MDRSYGRRALDGFAPQRLSRPILTLDLAAGNIHLGSDPAIALFLSLCKQSRAQTNAQQYARDRRCPSPMSKCALRGPSKRAAA
jgi:hypothetical protein